MNNVTQLPLSPYESSPELANDLRRVVSSAWDGGFKSGHTHGWNAGHDVGFAAGEAVARHECLNAMLAARDKAVGVGLLIGVGLGVILAAVAELIVADKEHDEAREAWHTAPAAGREYREAHGRYIQACERRRAALARVGGES